MVGSMNSVLYFNLPILVQGCSLLIGTGVLLQYLKEGPKMKIGKKCKTRLRNICRKPATISRQRKAAPTDAANLLPLAAGCRMVGGRLSP